MLFLLSFLFVCCFFFYNVSKHSSILFVALPSAYRSMHAVYIIMYALSNVSHLLNFALNIDPGNSWVAQQVAC